MNQRTQIHIQYYRRCVSDSNAEPRIRYNKLTKSEALARPIKVASVTGTTNVCKKLQSMAATLAASNNATARRNIHFFVVIRGGSFVFFLARRFVCVSFCLCLSVCKKDHSRYQSQKMRQRSKTRAWSGASVMCDEALLLLCCCVREYCFV